MMSDFYLKLNTALNEKDVENIYRHEISKQFNKEITSPYNTDGYLDVSLNVSEVRRRLTLLMEFKYDEDFLNHINVAKVLIQSLYYLKRFEEDGERLPNIILIGDKNEVFVLHTNYLIDYLDEDIDWSLAPSSASQHNPELVMKIHQDPEVTPFIHVINEEFDFNNVIKEIKRYATNVDRKVRITDKNISIIYNYFLTRVIKDYQKYTPNELVSIFISLMLDKGEYLHPKKSNVIVLEDKELHVDEKNYKAFFKHFEKDYRPSERRKFTEIADRLIEETKRRIQGEFYTPAAFVEYSQELLSKYLGSDWRRKYVVWDNSWGTGNLTKDDSFEHLFASTLHESDLDMGEKYNVNNTKFQYDFLNDDPHLMTEMAMFIQEKDTKIPKQLYEHLQNSHTSLLFYMNPPYATGGNANAKNVHSKFDLGKTIVAQDMKERKLRVSEQLYAQFLFRIVQMKRSLDLKNVYIGVFSPTLFLTGQKYKEFREEFFSEFEYVAGAMFRASYFADVQDTWAIGFTIWRTKSEETQKVEAFKLKILNLNEVGKVEEVGVKTLWNLDDDQTLQSWLNSPSEKGQQMKDQPIFTSAFKYTQNVKSIRSDALGFFINDTNNIEATAKGCYLMSSKITRRIRTVTLIESNFSTSMVAFTGRNIVRPNWINQKDEFSAPDTQHPNYKKFEVLSVVYSIFSPKNNVISYRDLKINDKTYNWRNEWFFLSNAEMREISDNLNNDDIYNDSISNAGEAFVYSYLKSHEEHLTPLAQELLQIAREIIRETFRYRKVYHEAHPQYYLNTWDASWVQIKQMVKDLNSQLLGVFSEKFKAYELELLELSADLKFFKY